MIRQGPQLKQFKNGKYKKIEFLDRGGLGSGAHSHVWKVKIDNRLYALKMFRHIGAEEENAASDAKLKKFKIDRQLWNDQLSPFNCEARAYARLQEHGLEDVAWKCHGWVALDEETYGSIVWDKIALPRRDWFAQTTTSDAQVADRPVFPIYALVKQFIPDIGKLGDIDINKAHDIAQDINKIHRVGITHRDIHSKNYVDSRIMDFSASWTVPNVRLDRELKWDSEERINEADTDDYFQFDLMIYKWNEDHPKLPPCSYRMTNDNKYRKVQKAPSPGGGRKAGSKRGSESSTSSEEMEEVPRMERMADVKYCILPSSYGWETGTLAVALPDIIDPPPAPASNVGDGHTPNVPPPTPASNGGDDHAPDVPPLSPASNGGDGHTSNAPLPTPVLPRPGFRLPGSTAPRLTMVWSWSAMPPVPGQRSNGTAGTPSDGAPHSNLDAEKLEKIRTLAEGVISRCKTKANNQIKGRAEEIVKIIDEISVVLGDGDDDDGHDDGKRKKRPRNH